MTDGAANLVLYNNAAVPGFRQEMEEHLFSVETRGESKRAEYFYLQSSGVRPSPLRPLLS